MLIWSAFIHQIHLRFTCYAFGIHLSDPLGIERHQILSMLIWSAFIVDLVGIHLLQIHLIFTCDAFGIHLSDSLGIELSNPFNVDLVGIHR